MSSGTARSPDEVEPPPHAGGGSVQAEALETLEQMVRAADRAQRAETNARRHEENALLWCLAAAAAAYVAYRIYMATCAAIEDGTIRVEDMS